MSNNQPDRIRNLSSQMSPEPQGKGSGGGKFLRKLLGLLLVICALSLLFSASIHRFIYFITAFAFFVLGSYVVFTAFKWMRQVRTIKKEEKGFTDYTIE